MSCEQIVFLFLGIGLFAFNHPYEQMGWGLVVTTIINLNLARFLNIFIVSAFVNCQRTESKLSPKMKTVMWFSGLRGAMAYALALKCATDLSIGPVILIDTLIYSLITILGIGSVLNPLLAKLGVKRTDAPTEQERQDLNGPNDRPINCITKVKSRIRHFDNEVFAPLFIKDVKNIQRRNLQESFSDPAAHLSRDSFAFR